MLWRDVVRAVAVGCLAVLVVHGLAAALAARRAGGASTAAARRSSRPAFEAIVPDLLPAKELPAGELARPARAPDRASAARAAARRRAGRRSGAGARVRRGRGFVRAPRRSRCSCCARVRRRVPEHASHGAAMREGFALRPPPRLALGHARRRGRSPTSSSSARPRSCSRTWSRTSCTPRRRDLGLVFAAGGVGAIGAAVLMGQRGHPRRDVTFMYATWTLATLAIAGYGHRDRGVAADARLPGLQRPRDRGHDRLGDDQAAPRPEQRCSAASRASTG